jgi:hypothetical protein
MFSLLRGAAITTVTAFGTGLRKERAMPDPDSALYAKC